MDMDHCGCAKRAQETRSCKVYISAAHEAFMNEHLLPLEGVPAPWSWGPSASGASCPASMPPPRASWRPWGPSEGLFYKGNEMT